jgi:hypothetical protein
MDGEQIWEIMKQMKMEKNFSLQLELQLTGLIT